MIDAPHAVRVGLILAALAFMHRPAGAAEPVLQYDPLNQAPAAQLRPDSRKRAGERADDVVHGRSALVVSGGTSLGVYEAGVLYYYTLLQAQSERRPGEPFSVVGGTSAGAINAFFSAIATCEAPTPDPRSSPFWVWTEIDWNDLMDEPRTAGDCGLPGALSRKPIRDLVQRIAARWKDDTWRTCDVRFGAAVTHLTPRRIPLREGSTVFVRQLAERFALQLSTPKNAVPGTPPDIRPISDERPGLVPLPVLANLLDEPTADDREKRVGAVLEMLLASSGIPGVFEPIPLRVKYPDGSVRRDCFIDGGVLDNVPLSTTIRLMQSRGGGGTPPTYVYEDADNVELARPEPAEAVAGVVTTAAQVTEPGDVSRRVKLAQLLGNLVTGARQAELARTLEQSSAQASLELPVRKHFITGETFAAFGAFFDASFRRYDFLAGVVDAEHSLAPVAQRASVAPPEIASDELPCFRAVWRAGSPADVDRALAGADCAALRVPPSDSSKEGTIRRDLWRLLKVIGPGHFDRVPTDVSRKFLEALASVEGPPGAGWTKGYEYLTLEVPPSLPFGQPSLAGPREGLLAVRGQLNRLSERVAEQLNAVYAPLVETAGREIVRTTVGYQKVPRTLSLGMYGRGGEVSLASRLLLPESERFGVDGVVAIQLADYGLRGPDVRGYTDFRLALGPREELNLGLLQVLLGEFLVQQVGLTGGHRPLHRTGLSGRLEVQAVQRVYLGVAYTGFFEGASGWRQHDISLAAGLRLWL